VQIGQIVGAHGIRGQVKVEPLTDFLERFSVGSIVRIGTSERKIESFSMHKGRPLLKLSGIDTMTEAEQLQWQYIESDSPERPELEEDEFLLEDLLEMRVVTVGGEEIGIVDDVLESPAHEILVVGPHLIPFVDEFVAEVNFEADTITITPIPGLLDANSE
jgi:16S rRNA processing protein RimM